VLLKRHCRSGRRVKRNAIILFTLNDNGVSNIREYFNLYVFRRAIFNRKIGQSPKYIIWRDINTPILQGRLIKRKYFYFALSNRANRFT
jgi:hypothetical protein